MERRRVLPPTYLTVGLAAMVLLHFVFSGPRVVHGPWRLLGVPLGLAGLWVAVRADSLFKKVGTEVKPFQRSSLVVTEGLYRFSPHPMYLGFVVLLAGVGVLAGTLLPLVVVGVMFWLLSARFAIPEERHMEQQFGEEYSVYKSRVRMWL